MTHDRMQQMKLVIVIQNFPLGTGSRKFHDFNIKMGPIQCGAVLFCIKLNIEMTWRAGAISWTRGWIVLRTTQIQAFWNRLYLGTGIQNKSLSLRSLLWLPGDELQTRFMPKRMRCYCVTWCTESSFQLCKSQLSLMTSQCFAEISCRDWLTEEPPLRGAKWLFEFLFSLCRTVVRTEKACSVDNFVVQCTRLHWPRPSWLARAVLLAVL